MSTVNVQLPESLHQKVRELAARDRISIDQFITVAVAEKMSALLTSDYLRERAQRGSRSKFERVLAKVPDIPPERGDEWPTPSKRQRLGSTRRSRRRPGAGRT
ncbi:MAG: toxin-antitoxin system HicB family antitoxin [Candidatus Binatia bacterium]|jgi:hypothetical protein